MSEVALPARRIPGLSIVTGAGWVVLITCVAAWWLGVWLGWVEMLLAGATGVLAFVVGAAFTVGGTDLDVALEPRKRRIVVGETTRVDAVVVNNGRRRLLPLTLEVGESHPALRVPSVGGCGAHRDDYPIHGVQRGLIQVGPATSVRGDPLGLLQRRVQWTRSITMFVHPATLPLAPLGSGLLRDLEGRPTDDLSMTDLAFHALREYAPGDDRRFIHWPSSAKVNATSPDGTFLVRQFRDTRRTQLLVVIDGDRAAYTDPEDFETAVSVGASVAKQAVVDDLEVTLFVADQWTGKRLVRGQSVHHVLDTCARAQFGSLGLQQLVPKAVRATPEATFVLLVTGAVPAITELRRVAAKMPSQARVTAVRVDPNAPHPDTAGSAFTVHTLTKLRDLRVLLARGEGG